MNKPLGNSVPFCNNPIRKDPKALWLVCINFPDKLPPSPTTTKHFQLGYDPEISNAKARHVRFDVAGTVLLFEQCEPWNYPASTSNYDFAEKGE